MEKLTKWVKEQLSRILVDPDCQVNLVVLSGDASFRRYYRVSIILSDTAQNLEKDRSAVQFIAVDAPPDKEKNEEFAAIADILSGQGVLVPQVYAKDFQQGFMLLSDLGDQLLLPHLHQHSIDGYYQQAMDLLVKMQRIEQTPAFALPAYSNQLLLAEMGLFSDWFIGALLGLHLNAAEQQMLAQSFEILADSALAQPQRFVHRDYHSRNLMLVEQDLSADASKTLACNRNGSTDSLATIDFQDAVWGPISYDLVSLLRDCYIVWPQSQVRDWVASYYSRVKHAADLCDTSLTEFQRWFDLMGLQRHIKVLGIFARLAIRDGKQAYLQDLPTVISYVLSVAHNYPELEKFVEFFEARLLPMIERQNWSSAAINTSVSIK